VSGSLYNVKSFCANDSRRSLVVWTKIMMKLEFPQNFYEAANFSTILAANTNPSIQIPPKSSYIRAMQGIPPASLIQNPPPPQAHLESAALLYISLTQGRRGMKSFNPNEQLGPHAIGDVDLYGKSFKCFVDTWGTPIAFIRWPTGAALSDDINQPPFQVLNTIGGVPTAVDPQDPER